MGNTVHRAGAAGSITAPHPASPAWRRWGSSGRSDACAPLARLGLYVGFPPLFPLLLIAFFAAGIVYDRKTLGRVHPINRWVPAAIFLTVPLRILVAQTDGWHALALWIIR